jgi:hypothetical protein
MNPTIFLAALTGTLWGRYALRAVGYYPFTYSSFRVTRCGRLAPHAIGLQFITAAWAIISDRCIARFPNALIDQGAVIPLRHEPIWVHSFQTAYRNPYGLVHENSNSASRSVGRNSSEQ